ncbi:MAG TPA: serine/threonine-protein kinase, partial [Gemmatales bacterium]|nr:serine/threonine-protein kinase [Gemmatales bacterium]
MPAIASTARFLELVRKSKLVDERKLTTFLQRYQAAGGEDAPVPMATKMVHEGVLSTFQAKQLLQGRWRRFVINNKYKVLEMLGQGGMGSVYLCEQFLMRRLVALKMVPEDKLLKPGALERFLREARAIATLDHPNIVHAYDMDQDEHGMHFMVMEYVDGFSLEILVSKLYKNKGMDPIRAAHYVAQAALGLQHAHELNWVHRDIKPANLLMDRQGIIKILDMGLTRALGEDEEELTKKYDGSSVLGTADYIAPEQALHVSSVDIRADIYSLGATFYFLLSGRAPFEKASVTQKLMYHQMKDPDPLTELRPEIPPEMAEVVAIMMAKNPDHRYPVPAAVVEALAPWTATPIPAPPDREMPALCPLVRELLPASSGSKSSGSWTLRGVSGSFGSGAHPVPRVPASGSSRVLPPAGVVETVSDSGDRGRALTPKSLPRVGRQALEGPVDTLLDKQKKQQKLLVLGAVSFLFVIVGLVALVLYIAFTTDSRKEDPFAMTTGVGAATEPVAQMIGASQARDRVGQRVYVEFMVRAVTTLPNPTTRKVEKHFLNSEPMERRTDPDNFLVVIPDAVNQQVLEAFKIKALRDLEGCRFRVEGTIQWYDATNPRRASIEISSPHSLELRRGAPRYLIAAGSKPLPTEAAAAKIGAEALVAFDVRTIDRVSDGQRIFLFSTPSSGPSRFGVVFRETLERRVLRQLNLQSLEDLEGRRLIVSGKVTEHRGHPLIEVAEAELMQLGENGGAEAAPTEGTRPTPTTP